MTDAVLGQVIVGPGRFDVQLSGKAVFDPAEQQHMVDVRRVFVWLEAGVAAAAAVLALAALRMRDRRRLWSAIRSGAKVLAGGILIAGVGFAAAFDQVFQLFHELLFPAGSYAFDPSIEHLVQIFPEQLFSEATVAMALVGLALAVGTWWFARRRVRAIDREAAR